MNRQSTDYFQGGETTLYDIIMVDTYTPVQTYSFYTKSEPECKFWISGVSDVSMQVQKL